VAQLATRRVLLRLPFVEGKESANKEPAGRAAPSERASGALAAGTQKGAPPNWPTWANDDKWPKFALYKRSIGCHWLPLVQHWSSNAALAQ